MTLQRGRAPRGAEIADAQVFEQKRSNGKIASDTREDRLHTIQPDSAGSQP